MEKELWCVHFIGPDDLFAAPNKEAAEERVVAYNEWIERTPMMRYCGMKAEAQVWPWTPEGHTESLAQWSELFPEGYNSSLSAPCKVEDQNGI
jgi:hypothetical protein